MSKKTILLMIVIVVSSSWFTWVASGKTVLVMATIGSDPSQKIKIRQPFIDYLAERLKHEGIEKGKVVVVEDIHKISDLFHKGKVDLFVDSPFPTLMLAHLAQTKMLLRRWKKGVAEYYSVIFVRKDSGITQLEDLKGKMISFEAPASTSGYFLPKTVLLDHGLKLKYQKEFKAPWPANEISYTFSGGDETTMVWVLRKKTQAGAIDFPNFVEDAKDQRDQLLILHQTEPVPRHIVSYRHDLPERLVKKIEGVLMDMDQSEEGKAVLQGYERTKKFDRLPQQSIKVLDRMQQYIELELNQQ